MSRALESIEPPSGGKRRKVNTGLVAMAALTGVVVLSMLSFGLLPWMFPGFAHADQLTADIAQEHAEVMTSVAEEHKHWSYEIEDALLTLRVQQCKATDPLKQFYARSIQQRLDEYRRLTGTDYTNLPACSDL